MIHECNCIDVFCDNKYGKGMRVFNAMRDGEYRCSTCHKEVMIAKKEVKKEEVKKGK